jgi:hypothetical protein
MAIELLPCPFCGGRTEVVSKAMAEVERLREQLRLRDEMLAATHAIEFRAEELHCRIVHGANGKWSDVYNSSDAIEYASALEAYAAIKERSV